MKKQITLSQLKTLVREGRAPRRVVKPRAAAPLKETFIIHYTDNARCMNRGSGKDTIANYKFTGTLQDVLNFGAWAMTIGLGDLDEGAWQNDVENGEWETLSVDAAKDEMDEADIGAGSPVVFWIKNSKGKEVYNSGLDESDWGEGGWDD